MHYFTNTAEAITSGKLISLVFIGLYMGIWKKDYKLKLNAELACSVLQYARWVLERQYTRWVSEKQNIMWVSKR